MCLEVTKVYTRPRQGSIDGIALLRYLLQQHCGTELNAGGRRISSQERHEHESE